MQIQIFVGVPDLKLKRPADKKQSYWFINIIIFDWLTKNFSRFIGTTLQNFGYKQNNNKSFNTVVYQFAPKHTFSILTIIKPATLLVVCNAKLLEYTKCGNQSLDKNIFIP